MKTYLVYRHYFHEEKSYIGWTDKGINERLRVHETDALFVESHNIPQEDRRKFHRAILKYGIENIHSEVLEICNTQEEVKEREKYWISFYDSYKNGYNMTLGGDGGNCIQHILDDPIKRKQWGSDISKRTIGSKNPNYSGFTDSELIIIGAEMYEKLGYWSLGEWYKICEEKGTPKSFSKNRFGGKTSNFKNEIAKYIGIDKLEKYKQTKKHKENWKKSAFNFYWVTNGIEYKQIHKTDLDKYLKKGYKRGRKLK